MVYEGIWAAITNITSGFSPLMWLSLALAVILVVLIVIIILRNFVYGRRKCSLKGKLKSKGLELVYDAQENKFILFLRRLFCVRKEESDIDKVVAKLQGIIDSEKELKSEERTLTRRIEELYKKTRPLIKESPSFKVSKKKQVSELDEETRKVLLITDELLEKLPAGVIDEFVNSKDFETYQQVVSKAKGEKK